MNQGEDTPLVDARKGFAIVQARLEKEAGGRLPQALLDAARCFYNEGYLRAAERGDRLLAAVNLHVERELQA